MVGCFLLNDPVGGKMALDDTSLEVRAMAAWTLIRTGMREKGMAVLENLLLENSYASLKVLNIIDWLGPGGRDLINTVEKMEYSKEDQRYESRMQSNLAAKFDSVK